MDEKSKRIAKYLTILRINKYHSDSCQKLLSDTNVLEVYALSSVLIAKLLRLPMMSNINVLGQFGDALQDYAVNKSDNFVFFSAQLLQYYTVMCDTTLKAQKGRIEKINYLQNGKHAFGDINGNFLVLKYCAILVYNYMDALKQQLLSIAKEEHKEFIEPVVSDLKFIDKFMLNQLDNLAKMQLAYSTQPYINYLQFVYNYVYLSVIEVSFLCKLSKVNDDFYTFYVSKQAVILKESIQSLDKLNTGCLSLKNFNPFFLGQPPFGDFPISNYNDLRAHLKELFQIE